MKVTLLAEVPEGYVGGVFCGGICIACHPDKPPLILNKDTKEWEEIHV